MVLNKHPVEVRGQRVEVGSLLPHVGFRAWTQVTSVGYKCHYALSYLTNPKPFLSFL